MFPILLRAELEKWEVFRPCSQEVEREVEDIRKRRDREIEKILGSDYPKCKDWKERRRKAGVVGRTDGVTARRADRLRVPPPGASKDPAKLRPAPQ